MKIAGINLIQSKKFFNHSLEDAKEHGVRRSIVLKDAGVVVGGEGRTSQSRTKVRVTMEKLYVSSNKWSMSTSSNLKTLWDSVWIKKVHA